MSIRYARLFWVACVAVTSVIALASCADTADSIAGNTSSPVVTSEFSPTATPSVTSSATPTPTATPTVVATSEPVMPEPEPTPTAPVQVPEKPAVTEPTSSLPSTNSMESLPENPAGCEVAYVDSPSYGPPVRWSQSGVVDTSLQGLADQLGLAVLYEISYQNCRDLNYVGMGTLGTYCTVAIKEYPTMSPAGTYSLEFYRTDTNEYIVSDVFAPDVLRMYVDGLRFPCDTPNGGLGIA